MKPQVLLVEDDAGRGRLLEETLAPRLGCRCARTLDEAMVAFGCGSWSAVVASYDLAGGASGLEVLQVARSSLPCAFRVLYARSLAPGFRQDVERLAWPHFLADASAPGLASEIERALADLLAPPPLELPRDLQPILDDVIHVVAPVSRRFMEQLRAAAEQDTPVYVHGEPGTGVTRAGILLRRWRREWKERGSPRAVAGDQPVPILRMPSLRERRQDLPLLVARCLLEHARQSGESSRQVSARAMSELLSREWYGNVVELSGVLVRALQRAGTRSVIQMEDLPRDVQPPWRPSQRAKDDGQRDCVLRQLSVARNVSTAARLEGCSRANYIRLMRRLGIIRADVVTDLAREGRGRMAGAV